LWRIVDAVRTLLVVQGTRGVEILSGCYYDRITSTYVIAAAPPYAGRLAVVGGVGYMATGTASAADWKQIT
jgi:hypothetical protein